MTKFRPHRIGAIICVLFFHLAFSINAAFAWGRVGHAVVAQIAEDNLRPEARRQIKILLADQNATHLSQIASWADTERSLVKKGKKPEFPMPMHSVRLPLGRSTSIEAYCTKLCATKAIDFYSSRLKDRSLSVHERAIALNFVVHLVGDIHQPLHAAAMPAWAKNVTFDGKPAGLHAVWDSGIIKAQNLDRAALVKAAKTSPGLRTGGTAKSWALESRDITRDVILPNLKSEKAELALPSDYAFRNWPIVRKRLGEGGLRLAKLLNQTLG